MFTINKKTLKCWQNNTPVAQSSSSGMKSLLIGWLKMLSCWEGAQVQSLVLVWVFNNTVPRTHINKLLSQNFSLKPSKPSPHGLFSILMVGWQGLELQPWREQRSRRLCQTNCAHFELRHFVSPAICRVNRPHMYIKWVGERTFVGNDDSSMALVLGVLIHLSYNLGLGALEVFEWVGSCILRRVMWWLSKRASHTWAGTEEWLLGERFVS